MELKEYLSLIEKNLKMFFFVWAVALFLPIFFFFLKAQKYETVVSLNVGRTQIEQTASYQYDQYYRLLADESFSDTVLLWLKDPETATVVLEKAGLKGKNFSWRELGSIFQGKKLSANYSQVHFSDFSPTQAEKLVQAWQAILNQKTDELNQKKNQETSWFSVVLGKPMTGLYVPDYPLVFLVSLIVGFPLAVFSVLFIDYFKKEDANRN